MRPASSACWPWSAITTPSSAGNSQVVGRAGGSCPSWPLRVAVGESALMHSGTRLVVVAMLKFLAPSDHRRPPAAAGAPA
eukprot:8940189-Alexandrium_andersonii.AAC.1